MHHIMVSILAASICVSACSPGAAPEQKSSQGSISASSGFTSAHPHINHSRQMQNPLPKRMASLRIVQIMLLDKLQLCRVVMQANRI
jgi:hypothetical protein